MSHFYCLSAAALAKFGSSSMSEIQIFFGYDSWIHEDSEKVGEVDEKKGKNVKLDQHILEFLVSGISG